MRRTALITAAVFTAVLVLAVLVLTGVTSPSPARAASATCSDYPNQAAAQKAADTRDGDGDGIYCESLPCPCSKSAGGSSSPAPSSPSHSSADPKKCTIVRRVVRVGLSKTKYPAVRRHWDRAIRKGWPRTLTVHRAGAERRRSRLLAGIPTKPGYDRDEYPMAMARTTVKADVALVPSGQNRSSGSVQGIKLRRYCSGQKFRIVWY